MSTNRMRHTTMRSYRIRWTLRRLDSSASCTIPACGSSAKSSLRASEPSRSSRLIRTSMRSCREESGRLSGWGQTVSRCPIWPRVNNRSCQPSLLLQMLPMPLHEPFRMALPDRLSARRLRARLQCNNRPLPKLSSHSRCRCSRRSRPRRKIRSASLRLSWASKARGRPVGVRQCRKMPTCPLRPSLSRPRRCPMAKAPLASTLHLPCRLLVRRTLRLCRPAQPRAKWVERAVCPLPKRNICARARKGRRVLRWAATCRFQRRIRIPLLRRCKRPCSRLKAS